ncbi:hypothetical protein GXM_05883 [Nostoc sphaeroides CCNUC1]|uniref:Uncharacterized protein n=1 Tax=Nostoc sphaeroides CCNUC1 TaxID=2653204 RepID=A0A5P8W8U5_9NOSO|nr:hypothetical protein GXM_05883 [Nostoc sphaeroides CCNUC1]
MQYVNERFKQLLIPFILFGTLVLVPPQVYSGVQFSEIQKKCWNDLTARILVFSSNR